MHKNKIGLGLIAVSFLFVLTIILNLAPVSQNTAYHEFSDSKEILKIPNLLNVISNLPFLIFGLLGLSKLIYIKKLAIIYENKMAYLALFAGTVLVFFGSSYYHLWPDNNSLVWDRLPMTVAFMGLFSIVIGEYISVKVGRLLLVPFILLGLISVYYWHITELNGLGDLRAYAMVQFFPILAIPIILLTHSSTHDGTYAYWWLLAAYLLAKILEHFDKEIHTFLVMISGHSLKHIAAAIGVYILIRSYEHRSFRK